MKSKSWWNIIKKDVGKAVIRWNYSVGNYFIRVAYSYYT